MVRQVISSSFGVLYPSVGTVISDTEHTSCFEAVCDDSTTGVTHIPYGTLMMFSSFSNDDSYPQGKRNLIRVTPWVGGDTSKIVGMLVKSNESFDRESEGLKVSTIGKILTDGSAIISLSSGNPAIGAVVQAYNTVGNSAKHGGQYTNSVNAQTNTALNDSNVKALFVGIRKPIGLTTTYNCPVYFSVVKDGAANNKYGYFPAISE